jgi:hypothetical protein
MSFLDDIIDVGSSLWKNLSGSGVAAGIAKATALGYLLKEITESINKDNAKNDTASSSKVDEGVREQVNPDTEHAIPIVYGSAFVGGIVSDAYLTPDNKTMWYCVTICEKTGNLINGTPSVINIDRVYVDGLEVQFNDDGITVDSLIDEDGVVVEDAQGLIKIYLYNNGSASQVFPAGFSGTSVNATSVFPNWTNNHLMSDLVFALIRVDYNKDKGITGLDNFNFKIRNSMTEAGDVLFDYMTNTRYGAGIPPEEINA